MTKFWIVWNEARNEGLITDCENDALEAKSGQFEWPCSSVGEYFHECYENDRLTIEQIEL